MNLDDLIKEKKINKRITEKIYLSTICPIYPVNANSIEDLINHAQEFPRKKLGIIYILDRYIHHRKNISEILFKLNTLLGFNGAIYIKDYSFDNITISVVTVLHIDKIITNMKPSSIRTISSGLDTTFYTYKYISGILEESGFRIIAKSEKREYGAILYSLIATKFKNVSNIQVVKSEGLHINLREILSNFRFDRLKCKLKNPDVVESIISRFIRGGNLKELVNESINRTFINRMFPLNVEGSFSKASTKGSFRKASTEIKDIYCNLTGESNIILRNVSGNIKCPSDCIAYVTPKEHSCRISTLVGDKMRELEIFKLYDITACVGGNSIAFQLNNDIKQLTLIEKNKERYDCLLNNTKLYKFHEKVEIINDDATSNLSLYEDNAIFVDPIWGEDYSDKVIVTSLKFSSDSTIPTFEIFLERSMKYASLICCKIPYNYDLNILRSLSKENKFAITFPYSEKKIIICIMYIGMGLDKYINSFYKTIDIPYSDLKIYQNKRSIIVDDLVEKIISEDVEFPYQSYIINPQELAKHKPLLRIENDSGKHYIVYDEKDIDYYTLDVITEYFTEYARVKANVIHFDSPYNIYKKNPKSIVSEAFNIAMKYEDNIDTRSLSEAIWNTTKQVSNFSVSLAIFICDRYGSNIFFDPFAGWGDRAIGAALSDTINIYRAVDVNTDVFEGYEDIVNFLNGIRPNKSIEITLFPIEDFNYLGNYQDSPDLIFTSPPHFNHEFYSSDPGQSIIKYLDEESWVNEWFIPVTRKLWKLLVKGGYLIYHLSRNIKPKYLVSRIMKLDILINNFITDYYIERFKGKVSSNRLYVWKK